MIRKQSPDTHRFLFGSLVLPSVRFVFEFIMAVLFASYFYNTVSCTLPKAPGLLGVAEAEGFKKI